MSSISILSFVTTSTMCRRYLRLPVALYTKFSRDMAVIMRCMWEEMSFSSKRFGSRWKKSLKMSRIYWVPICLSSSPPTSKRSLSSRNSNPFIEIRCCFCLILIQCLKASTSIGSAWSTKSFAQRPNDLSAQICRRLAPILFECEDSWNLMLHRTNSCMWTQTRTVAFLISMAGEPLLYGCPIWNTFSNGKALILGHETSFQPGCYPLIKQNASIQYIKQSSLPSPSHHHTITILSCVQNNAYPTFYKPR